MGLILYFKNCCRNTKREIGRPETEAEVYQMIKAFLKEHDYISYYTRFWYEGKEKYYDVGSHSEFFVLYNEDGWDEL